MINEALYIQTSGRAKRISNTEVYKGQYEAKFAREAKEKPSEWIIQPTVRGYKLIHVQTKKQKCRPLVAIS